MQEQKNSLIRGGVLVLFIVISMGIIYMKVYRPMIQSILNSRESMDELKAELIKLEEGAKGIEMLTEKERRAWKLTQQQVYQMFPPAEVLPKYLTFKGSTSLFYGEGTSLQQQVPRLFLDLAQAMLRAGGTQLSLVDANQEEVKLTIPASGSEVSPLELEESTIMITFGGSFRQIGEFLGQLHKLRRITSVNQIAIRAEKDNIKTAVTIKTYHCQPGALSDVSE